MPQRGREAYGPRRAQTLRAPRSPAATERMYDLGPMDTRWPRCANPSRTPPPMHYLWMLIIGLVVGAVAKLIMPGKDPGGIIVTMLLGVAGALLAGFLGRTLGWYHEGEAAGFIASVIGAIILLVIYRLAT